MAYTKDRHRRTVMECCHIHKPDSAKCLQSSFESRMDQSKHVIEIDPLKSRFETFDRYPISIGSATTRAAPNQSRLSHLPTKCPSTCLTNIYIGCARWNRPLSLHCSSPSRTITAALQYARDRVCNRLVRAGGQRRSRQSPRRRMPIAQTPSRRPRRNGRRCFP